MSSRHIAFSLVIVAYGFVPHLFGDHIKNLQIEATENRKANWGHWGNSKANYSQWKSHSNRLIPIYSFGISLGDFTGRNSAYRNRSRIASLYDRIPQDTLNPRAFYMDQTDVYQLQRKAILAGKKYIILLIFDGMDWQTTRAAAIHNSQHVGYSAGRGTGLRFQDYSAATTDFGFFVCSAHNSGTKVNVTAQIVENPGGETQGGYAARMGGNAPWSKSASANYLIGRERSVPHVVTDSAASATSMFSGVKTYNGAINVNAFGKHVEPIAQSLQRARNFKIGIVSNVPISHATPAAAYANNVHRNDYQDITRDLVGLRSTSHRYESLPGVDVLIGCGWGVASPTDNGQGNNFLSGNRFITQRDMQAIDIVNGGQYVVATRSQNEFGEDVLLTAARFAYETGAKLLGLFGTSGGNLPYRTADGNYDPIGINYTRADIEENPTLADMTRAALGVLSSSNQGFWLVVEAGDVDWANHGNNIDNAIGSVLSGDDAFRMIINWVESRNAWNDTAVIVTADHGHYFVLDEPNALIEK